MKYKGCGPCETRRRSKITKFLPAGAATYQLHQRRKLSQNGETQNGTIVRAEIAVAFPADIGGMESKACRSDGSRFKPLLFDDVS